MKESDPLIEERLANLENKLADVIEKLSKQSKKLRNLKSYLKHKGKKIKEVTMDPEWILLIKFK